MDIDQLHLRHSLRLTLLVQHEVINRS